MYFFRAGQCVTARYLISTYKGPRLMIFPSSPKRGMSYAGRSHMHTHTVMRAALARTERFDVHLLLLTLLPFAYKLTC